MNVDSLSPSFKIQLEAQNANIYQFYNAFVPINIKKQAYLTLLIC